MFRQSEIRCLTEDCYYPEVSNFFNKTMGIKLILLYLATVLISLQVSATDNGLGKLPPLGWSTWKTCGDAQCTHDFCSEAEVMGAATSMLLNGMSEIGWNHVILDDCWASHRNETSMELEWDVDRFPRGIPFLIDWLHARGLKFGLYTSAGNQTCSSGGRTYPIPGSYGFYDVDAHTFARWNVDYVKLDWCGDIKLKLSLGAAAHKNFSNLGNYTHQNV